MLLIKHKTAVFLGHLVFATPPSHYQEMEVSGLEGAAAMALIKHLR